MELSVNSFLQGGKYRIVRYISSGGFGCTYEAEHVLLGKRVAIKEFFVKDFCNRDEHTCQVTVGTESKKGLVEKLRKKFIDEARALSGLHHPGIVSVSDVFEENGTAYYVMDYINGCSLSDLVRREGPLNESRALGYIRQVCAALSYVHAHGRLHLDIKPGNIMIDQEGNAILIDFGASKQYDECGGENTSTLMGRTPGYAPLEQLGNDVVKFLPATDIYAVGATLYKLLTGVTPLSANRLASGESLPPLPAQVSAATRKAVETAMCLNKMQRPQNVDEFVCLLDESQSVDDNTEINDDIVCIETKRNGNYVSKIINKWTVLVIVCLIAGLVFLFKPWGGNKNEFVVKDSLALVNGIDPGLSDSTLLVEEPESSQSMVSDVRVDASESNQLESSLVPTPINIRERTIKDILYFPYACFTNDEVQNGTDAREKLSSAFGSFEKVNVYYIGLHRNSNYNYTYRNVDIGLCFIDWSENRSWYYFYFDSSASAETFYNSLVNDVIHAGIPLKYDKIYGNMSNRKSPVSIFKWVYVSAPVKVKEADNSNINRADVVGKYYVELGVYKR